MSAAAPPPITTNPLRRFAIDLRGERASDGPLPPGFHRFSMARTREFSRNPLPMLVEGYARWGPVFTIRILHVPVVFMLGPEASHFVTVAGADKFRWRDGSMGDLIPLLGDGLLTIDGAIHKRARRIMLPAFHRERIAAMQTTIEHEVDRALYSWRDGQRLDLYHWTRDLALRIAMRALFGFDPDRRKGDFDAAEEFERALSFYGRDYLLQIMRGPATPWRAMRRARAKLDRLIFAEIARRRATDHAGEDILSMLIEAEDEDGSALSDQQVRDQVMTLLFAGHDTTTSTVAFLFYELSRQPGEAERARSAPERLEMCIDETLRLYPPAWVGPRRAIQSFDFAGHHVAAGTSVNYCSWASHHLPDVFEDPEAFRPDRFAPEAKARLAKGAYVPFGGGSRICIGMRFGQQEIRTIATRILERHRLELTAGYELSIRMMPTLSPRGGLPVIVRDRATA